jgi:hypothetical protein
MSYEGSVQNICANGHYSTQDTYDDHNTCQCGAAFVWTNQVDETNCEEYGYIEMKQFIREPEQVCTCHCGHQHNIREALYRIPSEAETTAARLFWDGHQLKFRPASEYDDYTKEFADRFGFVSPVL